MGRYLLMFIAVILTSFFLFPFDFTFLPSGINTKMMMAAVSVVLVFINLAKKGSAKIGKDSIVLVASALAVSLATYISVVLNDTTDYMYVSYVVSAMVWLGGAYTMVSFIKWVHGYLSVWLIVRYLAAVVILQCCSALALDSSLWFYGFVHRFMADLDSLAEFADGRIYGIGAMFDVAGMRFSAILLMMGYCFRYVVGTEKRYELILYFVAYVFMSVVGSMISRTANIGVVFGLLLMVYSVSREQHVSGLLWSTVFWSVLGALVVVVYMYHADAHFQKNIRFAFEGFFSLAEKGRWEVSSNEMLVGMVKFPDNFRTWIIGDGYFQDTRLNPYYTGPQYINYYMGVDIGYLRFIYYSGLIGLSAFTVFIYNSARICINRLGGYRMMFSLLFVLQLIVWLKVSSDIFAIFAIFLAYCVLDDKTGEETSEFVEAGSDLQM